MEEAMNSTVEVSTDSATPKEKNQKGKGISLGKRLERIERLIAIGTKEVLDTSELALYLHISESRLRALASQRGIPYYKNEFGRICYRKSEIDNWRLGERVKTKQETDDEAKRYCSRKRLGLS